MGSIDDSVELNRKRLCSDMITYQFIKELNEEIERARILDAGIQEDEQQNDS